MGFFAIVWTTVAVIGVILVAAIGYWVHRLDEEDLRPDVMAGPRQPPPT